MKVWGLRVCRGDFVWGLGLLGLGWSGRGFGNYVEEVGVWGKQLSRAA